MIDKEEILKALETIKNVCRQCDGCENCPFRVGNDDCYGGYVCGIQIDDTPAEWKIKPREESWRAFED